MTKEEQAFMAEKRAELERIRLRGRVLEARAKQLELEQQFMETASPEEWQEYCQYKKELEKRYNKYHDPRNGRFTSSNSGLTYGGGSDIIKPRGDVVALEYQRYGRNKDTIVNKTYIDSGEYRRKFDNITDDPNINRALYQSAKEALIHRSGTRYEDMYWIDESGKVVFSEKDSKVEKGIEYTDNMKAKVANRSDLVTIHTHPDSFPPSIEDFNSCCNNNNKFGVVACHDGKVFVYSSNQIISEELYEMYISRSISDGMSEYDAQINALNKLKLNHDIDFREV